MVMTEKELENNIGKLRKELQNKPPIHLNTPWISTNNGSSPFFSCIEMALRTLHPDLELKYNANYMSEYFKRFNKAIEYSLDDEQITRIIRHLMLLTGFKIEQLAPHQQYDIKGCTNSLGQYSNLKKIEWIYSELSAKKPIISLEWWNMMECGECFGDMDDALEASSTDWCFWCPACNEYICYNCRDEANGNCPNCRTILNKKKKVVLIGLNDANMEEYPFRFFIINGIKYSANDEKWLIYYLDPINVTFPPMICNLEFDRYFSFSNSFVIKDENAHTIQREKIGIYFPNNIRDMHIRESHHGVYDKSKEGVK